MARGRQEPPGGVSRPPEGYSRPPGMFATSWGCSRPPEGVRDVLGVYATFWGCSRCPRAVCDVLWVCATSGACTRPPGGVRHPLLGLVGAVNGLLVTWRGGVGDRGCNEVGDVLGCGPLPLPPHRRWGVASSRGCHPSECQRDEGGAGVVSHDVAWVRAWEGGGMTVGLARAGARDGGGKRAGWLPASGGGGRKGTMCHNV